MKVFRLLVPVLLVLAATAVAAPATAYGYGGTTGYDANAAVRYALRWSDASRYNPVYPRRDDDAANFVSQALEAGGWDRRPGVWTPGGRAWSRPADLYRFAVANGAHDWGRQTPRSDDIWTLRPGDLLFADWTSDGTVDHVMIVTGLDTLLGFTEPTISQHSPHRHDLPLSIAIKIAALDHDDMSFHPVSPTPRALRA